MQEAASEPEAGGEETRPEPLDTTVMPEADPQAPFEEVEPSELPAPQDVAEQPDEHGADAVEADHQSLDLQAPDLSPEDSQILDSGSPDLLAPDVQISDTGPIDLEAPDVAPEISDSWDALSDQITPDYLEPEDSGDLYEEPELVEPTLLIVEGGPLDFFAILGLPLPDFHVISVATTGEPPAPWSVKLPVGFKAQPSFGAGVAAVEVSFVGGDSYGPGDHELELLVVSEGSLGSPAQVPMFLHIEAQPILSVESAGLDFFTVMGFPSPDPGSFGIANNGGGSLEWTVDTPQGFVAEPSAGSGAAEVSVSYIEGGFYAPGVYNVQIQVEAADAVGSPAQLPVTLHVEAQPGLSLDSAGLSFSSVIGFPSPAPGSFSIANEGGGPLDWTVSAPSGFAAEPASGSGAAEVSISYLEDGSYAPGDHDLVITVEAVNATGSPAQLAVTLHVEAQPGLSLDSAGLSFSSVIGFPSPAPGSFSIANEGGGPLDWTVAPPSGFAAEPVSGSGAAEVSISYLDDGSYAPGDHDLVITVEAVNATGSPAELPVTLHVEAQPLIQLDPPVVSVSHVIGFPAPEPVYLEISNGGGGPLEWMLDVPPGFVAVPNSGIGPSLVELSFVWDETYPAGDHALSLGLSAINGANSPLAVPVALHVEPPLALELPTYQLRFTALAGEWASAPVDVLPDNAGGGTLYWEASTEAAWLSIEPATGDAGAQFEVAVSAENLPDEPGSYEATILVEAEPDAVDWVTLDVTVEVVSRSAGPFTTQFSYDDAGRLSEILFPDDTSTEFEYGPGDQPTTVIWPDGSTAGREYDEAGKVTQMSDGSGQMDFAWNEDGFLEEITYPDSSSFLYFYDMWGRLKTLQYPDGTNVQYVYDSVGQLVSVSSPSGTVHVEYDELSGGPSLFSYPGGVTLAVEYDDVGRVTAEQTSGPQGELIVRYEQQFGAGGLRSSLAEITSDGESVREFAYDSMGRLSYESGPEGEFSYSYDLSGRRVERTGSDETVSYDYDQDGRLIRAGQTVYRYDDRGRRTQAVSPEGVADFVPNGADRLQSVSIGGQTLEYGYAPSGSRSSVKVGESEDRLYQALLFGIPYILHREAQSGTGGQKTRFVYGINWLLEEREGQPARIVIQDLLGNVTRVLALDGSVEASAEFTAFGERSGDDYPIGYRGEEQDSSTGFVHLKAREYDPATGVFLSKDSVLPVLASGRTLDRYVYAGADPVNYADSDGRLLKELKDKFGQWGQNINDWKDAKIAQAQSGITKLGVKLFEDQVQEAVVSQFNAAAAEELAGPAKLGLYFEGKADGELTGPADVSLGWGDWKPIKLKLSPEDAAPFLKDVPISNVPATHQKKLTLFPVTKSFEKQFSASPEVWLDIAGSASGVVKGHVVTATTIDKATGDGPTYNFTPKNGPKGGVALNKAADVISGLADIEGAAYDSVTGQLVLYGPADHASLPPMDLDDFVTSYRAVFLHSSEDPGVTMGNVPPPPGFEDEQGVKYFGGVDNTFVGWVFFEADRLLKVYSMGEDNISHEPVDSSVPGYKSMLQRGLDNPSGEEEVQNRMWFVPDEVELTPSPDAEQVMLFSKASMKVLTESKLLGEVTENVNGEAFAAHFTDNFDLFAEEAPVLEEMRRVMKIVSVLQWIRDEEVPIDSDWIARYVVPGYETPYHTPTHEVSGTTPDGTLTVTITGGVDMGVENTYDEENGAVAAETAGAALQARPADETQGWTFENPEGGELTAAAIATAPEARAGYDYLAHRDVGVRVPGSVPLELARFCAPFDALPSMFGYCWEARPHALRQTGQNKTIGWTGLPAGRKIPTKLSWLNRRDNSDISFSLGGQQGNRLVYWPAHKADGTLYLDEDDTWSMELDGGGLVAFDPELLLSYEEDRSGNRTTYVHDDGARLVSMEHTCGHTITLAYDDADRVESAATTDESEATYLYDGAGNLSTIQKPGIQPVSITSDAGHVPVLVAGLANDKTAANEYDFLGRPISMGLAGGESLTIEYAAGGSELTIVDPTGAQVLLSYDGELNLTKVVDPLGRETTYEYLEGASGPTAAVDPLGRVTALEYDVAGRLAGLELPGGNIARFYYSNSGQLIGVRRSELPDVYILRDSAGRVDKVYHKATLNIEDGQLVSASINDSYTEYSYDANGQVSSVLDSAGVGVGIERNERGDPTEVVYPTGYTEYRSYDGTGRPVLVERSDGSWMEFTYHATGRIESIASAEGTFEFEIAADGTVDAVTDPSGFTTEYVWDSGGRLAGMVHPDDGTTSYARDSLGRVTSAADSSGWSISLEFDPAGQLSAVTTGTIE